MSYNQLQNNMSAHIIEIFQQSNVKFNIHLDSLQGLPLSTFMTVAMVDSVTGVMVDCQKVKTNIHVIQNYVCSLALTDFNNCLTFTAVNEQAKPFILTATLNFKSRLNHNNLLLCTKKRKLCCDYTFT